MNTMSKFQKINDSFYILNTNIAGVCYVLEFGTRGIYSQGKAWRLYQIGNGGKTLVACFTVCDDGNKCYEIDYGSRLWTFDELIKEATKMVNALTISEKSSVISSKMSDDIKERIKILTEEAQALFSEEAKRSEPSAANWLLYKAIHIINSLISSEQQTETTLDKKAFKVHISETFGRNVIIYAKDESEACELAEKLCNDGVINITINDNFVDRIVETTGVASEDDKKNLYAYT